MASTLNTSAARANEYSSLRAELVSLQQTVFKLWRWGLAEIAALIGMVLGVTLTDKSQPILTMAIKSTPTIIVLLLLIGLFAVGLSILWMEASSALNHQDAISRLGGYIAVFHDLRRRGGVDELGWHVWNRIEREIEKKTPARRLFPLRIFFEPVRRVVDPDPWFLYFIALLIYLAVLTSITAALIGKILAVILLVIGSVLTVWFGAWLYESRQNAKDAVLMWSARWEKIANLDNLELNIKLKSLGIDSRA